MRYYTKDTKSGYSTIYLSLNYNYQRINLSTKLICESKFWNPKKQNIKASSLYPEGKVINEKLANLNYKILTFINEYKNNKGSSEEVKGKVKLIIHSKQDKDLNFNVELNKYIRKYSTQLSKSSNHKLYQLRNRINDYQYHVGRELTFMDFIGDSFVNYRLFRQKVKGNIVDYSFMYEYVQLKRFIKETKHLHGLEMGYKFIGSSAIKRKEFIYFSEENLNQLKQLKFYNSKYEEFRDAIICMCRLGLRYSDYKRINIDTHLKKLRNGKKYINIINWKNMKDTKIPINTEVLNYMYKYNYNLPKIKFGINRSRMLIKYISYKIGLNYPFTYTTSRLGKKFQVTKPAYKHIGVHTTRRTFATLSILSGVPITVVSKLMGHSNVQVTQRYIHADADDILKQTEGYDFFF